MTFEEEVSRITTFEERLKSQNEPENNNLLMVSSDNQPGNWHHGNGRGDQNHGRGRGGSSFRGGSGRGRSMDRGNRDKREFKCYECGEFGHFAYECSKRKDEEKEKDELAHLALEEEPML
ncbi:cold shock protein 2-like [Helianthus annuus]|uniref:cold shock protein 2-like n=1 Tax=Helianthus annuus TaxID=4232 RepID=UPI000B8F3A37|nr:cold shock protein 2-like [Helianthus annuus]